MKWDADWLHFSRRARRGIYVLLFFFVVVAVTPRFYYKYFKQHKEYVFLETPIEEEKEVVEIPQKEKSNQKQGYRAPTQMFNPNDYALQDWVAVGLSKKQAQTILNYRDKGGRFITKDDLKKSFVISEELFEILEPFVDLPSHTPQPERTENKVEKEPEKQARNKLEKPEVVNKISINTASEEELMFIHGIGPFFAKEIVKLRNQYGGIISPDQLLAIYRMDEETIAQISPYLTFDEQEVKKININDASYETLRKHPLIHPDMAKSIVYYREKWGEFKDLGDLLATPYIDTKVLKELKPYLKVQ